MINATPKPQKSQSFKKDGYTLLNAESLVETGMSPAAPSNDILTEKNERASIRRSKIIIVALCIVNLGLLAQCLGHISIAPLQRSIHLHTVKSHIHSDGVQEKQSGNELASQNETVVSKRALTTALTEPSVHCELCSASDDFCMELGSV